MFVATRNFALPVIAASGVALLALSAGAPASAQSGCSQGSTGLVLSVSPAANEARLERSGQSAPLTDLTMLCPGDRVVLGAGETAQLEVQGDRRSGDTLQGPAEYQVPATGGMLDNAAVAVANVFFPAASTRTRTLVSRSGSSMSPRPDNLGVRLPQELAASAAPRALWFGWSGGVPPLQVTLETAAGEVLASAAISVAEAEAIRTRHRDANGVVGALPYDVTFAPLILAPGAYQIRVFDAHSEPPGVAALVSDAEAGVLNLPIEVRADLGGVTSRGSASPESDFARIVDAVCFSLEHPKSRIFEAAQHIVNGGSGEPYFAAMTLLGADADDESAASLCR
jgi:hypothetical protein